jgi:gluconate kinase
MHAAASLLENIHGLIVSEREALSADDLDKADELAARRGELLEQVWQDREGWDAEELRDHLFRVLTAQAELITAAEALQQKYREQQKAGRKHAKYFSAERHLHTASRRALYCDTQS